MKNIQESINFPAAGALGLQIPEEALKLNQTYVDLLKEDKKDEAEKVLEEIKSYYTDEIKQTLAKFNIDSHLELIKVNITVGEVLFSIYISNVTEPTAPLQKAVFGKKTQELADLLMKDEFEMTKELESLVKDVLENDEKWEKTAFNAYVILKEQTEDQKEERFYIGLNSNGVGFFGKVLQEIINHYMV